MEEVVEDNTFRELQWFRIPTPSESLTKVMDCMSWY